MPTKIPAINVLSDLSVITDYAKIVLDILITRQPALPRYFIEKQIRYVTEPTRGNVWDNMADAREWVRNCIGCSIYSNYWMLESLDTGF